MAKFFVFAAAVEANYIWLAVIGVINSIIGLYYYLTVLKYVYLYRTSEEEENNPIPITRPNALALTVLTGGILLLGTVFGPWFNLANFIISSYFKV